MHCRRTVQRLVLEVLGASSYGTEQSKRIPQLYVEGQRQIKIKIRNVFFLAIDSEVLAEPSTSFSDKIPPTFDGRDNFAEHNEYVLVWTALK